ncbi:MAG TPA: hypothetical protein VIJ28_06860 [Chloroflexota bacterium]|jgi:hypothetical protein
MRVYVPLISLVCVLFPAASSGPRAMSAAPTIGGVPKNCPDTTHFVSLFNVFDDGKAYGGLVGSAPAWLRGFSGPAATLTFGGVYQPGYGWGRKVLFVLKRGFKGTVTMSGGSVRGHAPLWFDAVEVGALDRPVRRLTLQATRQLAFAGGAGPRQWPTFPGGITVPRAGCYYVEATWPGGKWRLTFAAGG